MGLLDALAGQVLGSLGSGAQQQHGSMVTNVLEMLGGGGGGAAGGLAGVVGALQKQGLGDVASSWVSTGQNMPISAQQIQSVLGSGMVQQLAGKMGLPSDAIAAQLATVLPVVVDKMTPNGKIEEGDLLQKGLSMLKGLTG
jgi:uncharacterized protein YidB (DUF937 family)